MTFKSSLKTHLSDEAETAILVEYSVSPPERQTHDYPGWPATCEILSVRAYSEKSPQDTWAVELSEEDEKRVIAACFEDAGEKMMDRREED